MSEAVANQKVIGAITVKAPDGGWGWMVVLGAFLNIAVVDGLLYTVGQGFQPVWEKHYDVNTATAAWVVSIFIFTSCITGPFVSILANKWGCRAVVIAGSLISASGFILSRFAPTVSVLYFTFGIIGVGLGIGKGFITMPSNIIMSYWFTKRRATATGIGMCGSGVGTFIFAPLISVLLANYSWEDALLIMTGLILNCVVFGCLYRPVKPHIQQICSVNSTLLAIQNERLPEIEDTSQLNRSQSSGLQDSNFRSRVASKTAVCRFVSEVPISEQCHSRNNIDQSLTQNTIKNLNQALSDVDVHQENGLSELGDNDVMVVCNNMTDVSATLHQLFSFDLMKRPSFILLAMSGFLTVIGLFIPVIYLPRCVMTKGISEMKATSLISILAVSNIVARIGSGWLSDLPSVDVIWLYNITMMVGGVSTIIAPHLQSYWMMAIYSITFGTTIACFACLKMIIAVELFGLERLTTAYGFLFWFMAFASLIGSPIAGSLIDLTGDYNLSFYVAGIFVFLSGLMCVPLRRINALELSEARQNVKQELSENNK